MNKDNFRFRDNESTIMDELIKMFFMEINLEWVITLCTGTIKPTRAETTGMFKHGSCARFMLDYQVL